MGGQSGTCRGEGDTDNGSRQCWCESTDPTGSLAETIPITTEVVQESCMHSVDETRLQGEPVCAERPAPEVSILNMNFEVNGETRLVSFMVRPLGLSFRVKDHLNVIYVMPKSHAAALGVEPGWIFTKVNGEDMTGKDLQYVLDTMQELSARVAVEKHGIDHVDIEFINAFDEAQTLTFTQAPFGFTFNVRPRLLVAAVEPNSHAECLGVQVGWEIKRVQGLSLVGGFKEIVMQIKMLSMSLPLIHPSSSRSARTCDDDAKFDELDSA